MAQGENQISKSKSQNHNLKIKSSRLATLVRDAGGKGAAQNHPSILLRASK
jgi:hypothetical protein